MRWSHVVWLVAGCSSSSKPDEPKPDLGPAPAAVVEGCTLGEKLGGGFEMQKPSVSMRANVTYAKLPGVATVEHDREQRAYSCIFQLGERRQDAVFNAYELITTQLEQDGWRVVTTDNGAGYVAGGLLKTFAKGSACRSVFWGCYLRPDDCAATVSEKACAM